MDKSAVFFDIDGTIWDYKNHIPESTTQAIRKLRANGHYAFLCSGRSRVTICAKELLDIGFDGIVAGCGTYVEYQGEVIFEHKLPWNVLSHTISILQEEHLAAMFEGSEKLYVDTKAFGEDAFAASLKESLGFAFQPMECLNENSIVNKLCVDYRHGNRDEMVRRLETDYDIIIHAFGPVAELLPKGFSKAEGIKRICEYLGIRQKHTYAFGDSANDIDMLQFVQYGIAMGNASDVAKEAADYVTTAMEEDGIRNGLKHFDLI